MKKLSQFLLLLIPYATFVAVCPVIGAAFFIPDTVFSTIGSSGLFTAISIGDLSLVAIFWTGHNLVDTGHRINQNYRQTETDKKS